MAGFIYRKPVTLNSVVIETERLMLTPIHKQYLQDIYTNFTPEIVTYMIPKSPDHISETETFIETSLKEMEAHTSFHVVIVNNENGTFLGCAGIMAKDMPEQPELGIWIKQDAQGKGYGFETIQGLKIWAESTMIINGLIYPVDRHNIRSRRIPEKMGGEVFKEAQIPTMHNTILDTVIYRIRTEKKESE